MKIFSALTDPAITTVLAGPNQQKLTIHNALLCSHTEYFKHAYGSGMREAHADLFSFEDVDASTIHAFFLWLYTGDVYLNSRSPMPVKLSTDNLSKCTVDGEQSDEDYDDASFVPDSEADEYDESDSKKGGKVIEGYKDGAPVYKEEEDLEDEIDDEVDWSGINRDRPVLERISQDRMLVNLHFGGCLDDEPRELDLYQLHTLLLIYEEDGRFRQCCDKWRTLLEEKYAEEDHRSEDLTVDESEDAYSQLVDLYILADRFGVLVLRRQVINHLQHEFNRRFEDDRLHLLPSFETIARAFANLPPNSPLRAWLADLFAREWDPLADNEDDIEARSSLPHDFVLAVMLINTCRTNSRDPFGNDALGTDLCYYHEHESWQEVKGCRAERGVSPDGGFLERKDFEEVDDQEVYGLSARSVVR